MQHEYLDGHELAAKLGIREATVRGRVHPESGSVPRPNGKAGKHLYWSRAEVARWLREQPRHIGSYRGGRKKDGL